MIKSHLHRSSLEVVDLGVGVPNRLCDAPHLHSARRSPSEHRRKHKVITRRYDRYVVGISIDALQESMRPPASAEDDNLVKQTQSD